MTNTTLTFEVDMHDIKQLGCERLEDLVFRLCEAEVSANGGCKRDVTSGGNMKTPDGGVDVLVSVRHRKFRSDFLPSSKVAFQVKRKKMFPAEIQTEMQKNGKLKESINNLLSQGGTYILVSSQVTCSNEMLNKRIRKMADVIEESGTLANGRIEFYDLSRIHQWVRCHPAIGLWIREVLNKPLYGWRPYGRWSSRMNEVDQTYILTEGISVDIPGKNVLSMEAEVAIKECRDLVRSTERAIRIIGQSGIGKTRFVQALFDKSIGNKPLDHSSVVYRDVSDENTINLDAMLEYLSVINMDHIIVLDDCSSELHGSVLNKIGTNNNIKLISIEYDVKDDSPLNTWIVRMSLNSENLATKILQMQHRSLKHANINRIVALTGGNPLLSRLLAEKVENDEDIVHLSDRKIFKKLFLQRGSETERFQIGAEVLSLVYSFNFSDGTSNELKSLAKLMEGDENGLYRIASELERKELIRKRGLQWAIFPQVLANSLARIALDNFPLGRLREALDDNANSRLLRAFSHRLGMLYDLPKAQLLVEKWMSPDGVLGGQSNIDKDWVALLRNIAPVAKHEALMLLEEMLKNESNAFGCVNDSVLSNYVQEMLTELAYDNDLFARCVKQLVKLSKVSRVNILGNDLLQNIEQLYQPRVSGTHATVETRISVMSEMLMSMDSSDREIGCKMWISAMTSGPWTIFTSEEHRTKYGDYGYDPSYDEHVQWRKDFLEALVCACLRGSEAVTGHALGVLSKNIVWLWEDSSLRDIILNAAQQICSNGIWEEGWVGVKRIERFQREMQGEKNNKINLDKRLSELEKIVSPISDKEKIITVMSKGMGSYEKEFGDEAERLGRTAASDDALLTEISEHLFCEGNGEMQERLAKGLAIGSKKPEVTWSKLISIYKEQPRQGRNVGTLVWFLSKVMESNWELAQKLLDKCVEDVTMRNQILRLHPFTKICARDIIRCTQALNSGGVDIDVGSRLLAKTIELNLNKDVILKYLISLQSCNGGETEVVFGVSLALTEMENWSERTKQVFAKHIFAAAGKMIYQRAPNRMKAVHDGTLARVLRFAYANSTNGRQLRQFMDNVMHATDGRHGSSKVWEYIEVIDFIVEADVKYFLTKVFEPVEGGRRHKRHDLLTRDSLNNARIDEIIEWCLCHNTGQAWRIVGSGIDSFKVVEEDGLRRYELTCNAKKFLAASTFPEEVLRGFTMRVYKPMEIMENNEFMKGIIIIYDELSNSEEAILARAASVVVRECRTSFTRTIENREQRKLSDTGFDF